CTLFQGTGQGGVWACGNLLGKGLRINPVIPPAPPPEGAPRHCAQPLPAASFHPAPLSSGAIFCLAAKPDRSGNAFRAGLALRAPLFEESRIKALVFYSIHAIL